MAARLFNLILYSVLYLSCIVAPASSVANDLSANPLFSSGGNLSSYAPVQQAFAFDFQQKGDQLQLRWQIKSGYYLYQQQFKFEPHKATLGKFSLPAGKDHHDEFFGQVTIYDQPVTITIPVLQAESSSTITVSYQGCASAGFCYPPETISVPLSPVILTDNQTGNQQPVITGAQSVSAESARLPFAPLWAILLGITIAFTPCVLPMYPLITSLILGGDRPKSYRRLLALSFSYVQGMALTYTLLGLVVASAGLQFQAALQHPYVLIGLAVLFCLLACSMFGFYSLQLPSSWQTRLAQLSNTQSGGSIAGVFIMGAIAGLICSPCTAAPLSAILLYIAQSGSMIIGGSTLYLYALGMGLPLIAVTLFGHRLLPRSGPWMQYIKEGFGFIILAVPIFLLQRIVDESWEMRLWSLWGVAFLGWGFVLSLRYSSGIARIAQLILLVAVVVSVYPLQEWAFNLSAQNTQSKKEQLTFHQVSTVKELQTALNNARGKKVMLDFYADWCTACREFNQKTFSSPVVQQQLSNMVVLQADVTANNRDDIALYQQMQIKGLPTILFFDEQGREINGTRIHGFLEAEAFMQHLQQLIHSL